MFVISLNGLRKNDFFVSFSFIYFIMNRIAELKLRQNADSLELQIYKKLTKKYINYHELGGMIKNLVIKDKDRPFEVLKHLTTIDDINANILTTTTNMLLNKMDNEKINEIIELISDNSDVNCKLILVCIRRFRENL